jgi:hypothetical protein
VLLGTITIQSKTIVYLTVKMTTTDPTPPPISNEQPDTKPIMIIHPDYVIIHVTPKLTYKVIRVLNHYIEHLYSYHQSEQHDIVPGALWHNKWKGVYPFIRSLKRTIIEIYQLLLGDYSENNDDKNPYNLFMQLLDVVPHLRNCYDIEPLKGRLNDKNYFKLTVKLYRGQLYDEANHFTIADEGSLESGYKGFDACRSISTWNTNISHQSVDSNMKLVPDVVHATPKQSDENSLDSNTSVKSSSNEQSKFTNDSNISMSMTSNTNNNKQVRFTKNQQQLKSDLTKSCTNLINQEMANVQQTLQQLIIQQKSLMQSVTQGPSPVKSAPKESYAPSPVPDMARPSRNSPTKKLSPKQHSTTSPNHQYFQRSGTLTFRYLGDEYELRDGQYTKNSSDLRSVKTKNDLLHYYEEMQSDAITYNIFLQPFDQLQPWVKYTSNTLPTTCMFKELNLNDNTVDAYNRMKNALYSKLRTSMFHDPEYKAIVKHGSIGKDGFEVLYELMTHCHPKLMVATSKVRSTNQRPELDSNDSIYTFVEKLETWLTIKSISGLQHTDDQILDITMEQMRTDARYNLAVQSINSELVMRDVYTRTHGVNIFPEHLKLYNLPGTVMSYYPKDERSTLFPTEDTTDAIVSKSVANETSNYSTPQGLNDLVKAIVNVTAAPTNAQIKLAREGVAENCEGCGMWGHNVFKTGCDKCAQYILIKRFLEKNEDSVKPILTKYKKHQ